MGPLFCPSRENEKTVLLQWFNQVLTRFHLMPSLDQVVDLKGVANVPHDMRHLLAAGPHVITLIQQAVNAQGSHKHALADVKLHAPIVNPDKVCSISLYFRCTISICVPLLACFFSCDDLFIGTCSFDVRQY